MLFALTYIFPFPLSISLSGNALPMPPELMELYNLYQMELETSRNNQKDNNLLVEAEKILRVREKEGSSTLRNTRGQKTFT
jgi:hypothetical protein